MIAGLLHDVVEDTEVTEEQVEAAFGVEVAATVKHCTEVKLDAEGRKRPWFDRKRDHLAAAAEATVPARAVMLADKLHNLLSIVVDHNAGRPVWSYFNAGHAEVLWYYRAMIERLGTGDPRLEVLAGAVARPWRRSRTWENRTKKMAESGATGLIDLRGESYSMGVGWVHTPDRLPGRTQRGTTG